MRIYEFAKQFNLVNKDVLKLLQDHEYNVVTHMSVLTPEAIEFLKKKLLSKDPITTSPISTKKEKIETMNIATEKKELSQVPIQKELITPTYGKQKSEPTAFVVESMSVGKFAELAKKSVSEVIMSLLKKGIIATKNQIISEGTITDLAHHFNIVTVQKKKLSSMGVAPTHARLETNSHMYHTSRAPVIVVVGHVDHGKTTLLDFIRKTRMAAREKGGITQHLGAYEAKTAYGSIVFIDTPGHEAFSFIRGRGIRVADIVVLVVAVDDGVMPQTIESLRAAQELQVPIIVALNKIDKGTEQQVSRVKQSLSSHGLTAEDWGGQTIIIPISAKTGQGVDQLLEMISLQAQIMELSANPQVPARGFVLEAKLEKGLGPVATVILQQGTLHTGDFIAAGSSSYGKVSAITNDMGKRLSALLPSVPALVAGFDKLPDVGVLFQAISEQEYRKGPLVGEEGILHVQRHSINSNTSSVNQFNIIIKADNSSTLEAIMGTLKKLSGKLYKECVVVYGGVGTVTERDIMLAFDTQSTIFTLHVRVDSNATSVAQKYNVLVKCFDIIYKMLEEIEHDAEIGRPIKTTLKKTGEATVLKVFVIKNLGVIAGAQVKTGVCSRTGKVVILRGKHKVGEGTIKSLQRDKKTVKEVHAGFECAFLVDGFKEWEVDDQVECYTEVAEN